MTLLEILVVLTIISLLSAVVAIAVIKYLDYARKESTRQSAINLRMVVTTYRIQHDECPTVEDLVRTESIDAMSKTKDAWEKPFVIDCDDKGHVSVVSGGPDKKIGTEDDIRAPEPEKVALVQ